MVCAKCQRLEKATQLATPEVRRKNDTTLAATNAKKGPTSAGIGKSKLLSKSAKNPYAAYASKCDSCKTQVDSGRKFCQRCSYSKQVCARCGKGLTNSSGGSSKTPMVQGQKFNAK